MTIGRMQERTVLAIEVVLVDDDLALLRVTCAGGAEPSAVVDHPGATTSVHHAARRLAAHHGLVADGEQCWRLVADRV
jgi:hypothetical protein